MICLNNNLTKDTWNKSTLRQSKMRGIKCKEESYPWCFDFNLYAINE